MQMILNDGRRDWKSNVPDFAQYVATQQHASGQGTKAIVIVADMSTVDLEIEP